MSDEPQRVVRYPEPGWSEIDAVDLMKLTEEEVAEADERFSRERGPLPEDDPDGGWEGALDDDALPEGEGHRLDAVLLMPDAAHQARRSPASSRQAWARKDHLVELRAWGSVGGLPVVVEALCAHTCLRAVFVGCGRSLSDHTAEEAAAMLRQAVEEHAGRCPDKGRITRRVLQVGGALAR